MLETQISQVAQQVASFSRSSGIFRGQSEPNPKARMNVVTLRNGKQVEPRGTSDNNVREK